MRGLSKKMFISILTSVIVFVTMVATTFAWVGIFTYANIDNFNLNLKVSDLDVNYYLTISATGEKNSFSDTADLIEIQRKILKNQHKWDEEYLDSLDANLINSIYSKNCTTVPSSCLISNDRLTDYYSINMKKTYCYETYHSSISYLKFDLYLSVGAKEGIQPETEINSNVFLTDIVNTLQGTICSQRLTNQNAYKEMPSIPDNYKSLLQLPDESEFKINSANATRFALCLYNPIDINNDYTDSQLPTKTIIYQGGNQNPSTKDGVFDLGGNLPEDYNTALQELLIVRSDYKYGYLEDRNKAFISDLEKAVERGKNDLELIEENSKLWNKSNNVDMAPYLGVHNGIQTKMKITVYFWFEGWDSDCIVGINEKPVTMNLTFTAGIDDF